MVPGPLSQVLESHKHSLILHYVNTGLNQISTRRLSTRFMLYQVSRSTDITTCRPVSLHNGCPLISDLLISYLEAGTSRQMAALTFLIVDPWAAVAFNTYCITRQLLLEAHTTHTHTYTFTHTLDTKVKALWGLYTRWEPYPPYLIHMYDIEIKVAAEYYGRHQVWRSLQVIVIL